VPYTTLFRSCGAAWSRPAGLAAPDRPRPPRRRRRRLPADSFSFSGALVAASTRRSASTGIESPILGLLGTSARAAASTEAGRPSRWRSGSSGVASPAAAAAAALRSPGRGATGGGDGGAARDGSVVDRPPRGVTPAAPLPSPAPARPRPLPAARLPPSARAPTSAGAVGDVVLSSSRSLSGRASPGEDAGSRSSSPPVVVPPAASDPAERGLLRLRPPRDPRRRRLRGAP